MRPVYFVLGWFFFGLGAVGAVVPGLPTVPLMLVALWAFARSSRRFHDWLFHHRLFGPPLQQWQNHGVIPARAKLAAVAMMTISMIYMGFFTETGVGAKSAAGLLMFVGAVFILSRPSKRPDSEPS